jgi:putative heme-binding domain-containing protein
VQRPEAAELLAVRLRSAPERLAARIAEALVITTAGCERLLDEVGAGRASPRLLKQRVVEVRLGRSSLKGIEERIARLTADLPAQDSAVEELLRARRRGFEAFAARDPERGAKVFEKSCSPCHRLGSAGTKLGPELSGVGLRGLDRLLEDVLDPNRNVDQAFRATVLVLKNGLVITGLLQSDDGEALGISNAEGKVLTIPKGEVRSREVSNLSPMPGNLAEAIPEEELHHLLAFLLAQRQRDEARF